ncbi:neural cell adhesion molecule 2-like isoform X2 [Panulirus ornatus]|uniref:neural cell adhesion molecule 2-like isoform X2 n=1 Tax=Panulirus ornatus TaxID=150431 RepID=UPI003A8BC4C1
MLLRGPSIRVAGMRTSGGPYTGLAGGGGGGGSGGVFGPHTTLVVPFFLLHLPRLLVLLHGSLLIVQAYGDYQDFEVDTSVVEVVAGYNASLPCTIHSPPHDSPILTLWYIGADETPVYSYDQRQGVSGESWADPQVFQGRAHYLAHLNPPAMLIMRTSVDDAHVYRCRVDFHNSNSRVAWVRLKVIVPPERVEIISHLSPVQPGDRNDVVCRAVGGSPPASVVWVQGGRMVDPNSTVEEDGTFNSLEVPASRKDLVLPFVCRASNNEVTDPVTATYTRNVTCGPVSVDIVASEDPLVEGREAEVTCTAIGSNPPALITWYEEGRNVEDDFINVTRQDNETVSVLSLLPARHHHGQQLLCRAENPSLPLATLEDILTLNVAYRPKAELKVGWPRRSELLTEGSDLFLECRVDANPPPYKIKFFHNGKELVHNVSAKVLVNEATLALQRVTRQCSGRYHCVASNVEGDSASKSLAIRVRYWPRCAMTRAVVGVAVGEVANVTCRVDADPGNVTFRWTFSNAAKRARTQFTEQKEYTTSGLTSVLSYRPESVRDYGQLICYATNTVGTQREPCIFNVVSAGPPERVTNCSVFNVTSHTAGVTCLPGFNGGLSQRFLHQIRLASSGELMFNLTSSEASFSVLSLQPDQRYEVTVTSLNARGRSGPRRLHLQTLKEAEMHMSLPSRPEPQPLVWVSGVGVGVVVAVVGLMVGVWWSRGRHSSHTLRNRDDGPTKLTKPDVTGEGRDNVDGLCVNGVVQHTIYDATGRYRGFAHLQQNDPFQTSCLMMTTTTAAPTTTATSATAGAAPEPPAPQSRFSLSRKGRLSSAAPPPTGDSGAKGTKEAMNGKRGTKGTEVHESGGKGDGKGGGGGGGEDGNEEGRKTEAASWRRVINQLTATRPESKFFDVWKIAGVKQAGQPPSSSTESVL